MTNEEQRYELVTQLIEGLIDDPRSLELSASTLPRRVNWRAKVDINDMGKLIGKQACHLYALRAIITAMGNRFQEDWKFQAVDPNEGPRADKPRVPRSPNVNMGPSMQFLMKILEAILATQADLEGEATADGFHRFKITIRNPEDYQRLVTAVQVGRDTLTPIAALGTLFRAYGRQQGASFTVEVVSK